jgi:ADP-heptose:LPS heptosyltransferase
MGVILGSSWPSRIYFAESIAAVIRALAVPIEDRTALFPVLLGGPDEAQLAASVIGQLGQAPVLNLAGRTSLRDLIGIFAECAVAFGPDSGPMHLAAAVGCPVVSLWGATSPERSAPWGFAELAISAEIPCHPCYQRQCPIGRECMRRIAPEIVVNAVRRALEARPSPAAATAASVRHHGQ